MLSIQLNDTNNQQQDLLVMHSSIYFQFADLSEWISRVYINLLGAFSFLVQRSCGIFSRNSFVIYIFVQTEKRIFRNGSKQFTFQKSDKLI